MAEMFMNGAVAAPSFAATTEATPESVGGASAGADPLTAACSAALAAMRTALLGVDGVAVSNEAVAGFTGTSNVQNLTQAEEDHATQLRDPLGQDPSGTAQV